MGSGYHFQHGAGADGPKPAHQGRSARNGLGLPFNIKKLTIHFTETERLYVVEKL